MTGESAGSDGGGGRDPAADAPPEGAGGAGAAAGGASAGGASAGGPAREAESPEAPAPELLEALVCPVSGGRLEYDRARGELVSRTAKLAYPIRNGIPIMLVDEARRLED